MPDFTLDLRYLRYAMVAADQGSLRRAADVLDIHQSTLSRRIQLLENRLGFLLFERDPRGVRLTSAGESFLKEAAIGVNHFDRAVQFASSMHRGERGELHIGILASLTTGFLHTVLHQFRQKHGGIKVRIHEASGSENIHRLTMGEIDICFVTGEPEVPGYSTTLLWSECVFAALPEGHRLVSKDEIAWAEIKDETFLVSSGGAGPEIRDYLVRRFAALGTSPHIEVQEVSRESLMNLVSIGYGLALTSSCPFSNGVEGVVIRPLAGDTDILPSSAIWSPKNQNPALRNLLALAKSIAQAHPCEAKLHEQAARS